MAVRRLDIDVDGVFLIGGRFEPRAMRLYKAPSPWLPIVRVLSVEKSSNRKVGGQGVRYRCEVLEGVLDDMPVQRTRVLWRETDDKWFVEEEVQEEL